MQGHGDRISLQRAGDDFEGEHELEQRDLEGAGQSTVTPTVLLWFSSSVNRALVSAPGLTQLDLPSPLTGLRSHRDSTPFPSGPHY